MRRRAHRLALWSKRVIDPLGGTQTIRWLGGQAFRLEVEGAQAPFRSLSLTGLVESWDVPMVWAWNRLHGPRFRSEEHTSELQSHLNLVCRLLLEKKNKNKCSR